MTWLAGEYYTVSLTELKLLAPNQTLGQNDSYLLGNANLSFGGTCTSTSGGTLFFTLYEVEIEGTIYLKLASTETYWLQVGTGGTDRLKMTVNLAFNPPDGEQVRSGQFTVRSRGALDVFEWDYRNRLTSVTRYLATAAGDSQQFTTPSGAEVTLSKAYTKHYVYNVYDQLIYEYRVDADTPAVKDNETVYIVQGGQRVAVLEKTAGSYDVTHLLLPDPTGNRMLAEQYINGATSHTIWPLHDQQGTVIAAISDDWLSDQDDVQHFKYDAYGLLKFDTEQDPSLANRLVSLHAGRDWDSVSELYYNRARWYDPAMQRFISQDPLGFAAGDTNLYRYCGNSPTNATDPSGMTASFWDDPLDWAYGSGGHFWDVNASTSTTGWIYRDYLAGGVRATLGDSYLSQAGGWELVGVAAAGATAGVLGGLAAAPLAASLGLGGFGTAMLAGGMAGGTEYLGMTLTAAGSNAYYGYGADVGPSFGGFGMSILGGAVGGGVFHGAGLAIGAGFRIMGNGLAAGVRATGPYVDAMIAKGMGLRILAMADGPSFSPAVALAVTRAATGVAAPPPTAFGSLGGLAGSHIAFASAGDVAPSSARGGANPAVQKAASRGSTLHSDKPGHLPDQLRQRYPDTQFEFTKPGQVGQDVRVVGGKHPSEYPGSNWPKGVDRADFKPNTPGGNRTFQSDQRNKWPDPTHMLPYDPQSGQL